MRPKIAIRISAIAIAAAVTIPSPASTVMGDAKSAKPATTSQGGHSRADEAIARNGGQSAPAASNALAGGLGGSDLTPSFVAQTPGGPSTETAYSTNVPGGLAYDEAAAWGAPTTNALGVVPQPGDGGSQPYFYSAHFEGTIDQGSTGNSQGQGFWVSGTGTPGGASGGATGGSPSPGGSGGASGGGTGDPPPSGSPGAAPEPSSWALMLIGFGGLGATLRAQRYTRQRRNAELAASR